MGDTDSTQEKNEVECGGREGERGRRGEKERRRGERERTRQKEHQRELASLTRTKPAAFEIACSNPLYLDLPYFPK